MSARADEIARNLEQVRSRVAAAARRAGRAEGEVELVVVTKFHPATDVVMLCDLGVRHIGENRDQEAAAKVAELGGADRLAARGVQTHFIGQLQSKKTGSVAGYADVVESVDRLKVVEGLERGALRHDRRLDILLQVSLDGDTARGGAVADDLPRLADAVAASSRLRLRGVMAVAPLGVDPARAFADLRSIADAIRSDHPGATWMSAGMSGDLEQAVAAGATHVRVGTAILGSRPSHQ